MNPVLVILWSCVAAMFFVMLYVFGWTWNLLAVMPLYVLIAGSITLKFRAEKRAALQVDPETGNLAANDNASPD